MSDESYSASGCPSCRGMGRVDDPVTTGGLLCTACAGTGNRQVYREFSAYRMGIQVGMDAMRDAMPQPRERMTLDGLQTALDAIERENQ